MLLAVTLVACGGQTPALTDPKEIITQGLTAMKDATSVHVDVAVTGSIDIPQTGGTFSLDGTTAAGDFDIANDSARITFEVPAFLGLRGEAIQIGNDSYIKTSVTGALYTKSTVADSGVPLDPDKAIADAETFLDKEGVVTEKLDDTDCGDRTCYVVQLTIPTSLLADAGAAASLDPSVLGESLVINLQFDQEDLRLRQVATDVDAGDAGALSLVVTFSKYGDAVEVSPPPSDQVTESGGLFN
jgi:hypothetical protein